MAGRPYTASERRGVIMVALAALLITAGGIFLAMCERREAKDQPVVIEMKEAVDSTATEKSSKKETKKSKKKSKSSKGKKRKSGADKNYRRRSPLDEPV